MWQLLTANGGRAIELSRNVGDMNGPGDSSCSKAIRLEACKRVGGTNIQQWQLGDYKDDCWLDNNVGIIAVESKAWHRGQSFGWDSSERCGTDGDSKIVSCGGGRNTGTVLQNKIL